MELHHLDEIVNKVQECKKSTMAVAGAGKDSVIDAVLQAIDSGAADAILVGEANVIQEMLRKRDRKVSDFNIVQTAANQTPAETAVDIINGGAANFLMKGMVETTDLLRPVVKKENGLRTGRTMSHVVVLQLPFYKKLLVLTDGGVCAYPDQKKKADIVVNAVQGLRALGYEEPKAAMLCCKETVDAKMQETLDAAAVKQMALRGELGKCIVEGPISYDLAMSAERAVLKKYDCPHCGDFDILVAPNIHAGNILGKSFELLPGVEMASYVAGAKIPVVLTSRAALAAERLRCIALAGLIAARSEELA